jgi:type II restriction enzyme
VDKANRIYDFVINTGKELYIIETNFYGGGGSKLKATVGEYKKLYEKLKRGKYKFIWITDGMGWEGTHKPLREAFDKLDYIVNLNMLEKGILDEIIK